MGQKIIKDKPDSVRPSLSTPESRAKFKEERIKSDKETKARMDQLFGPAKYDPALKRTCKFCKMKDLHWKQDFTGRWRLYDGHLMHRCAPGVAYSRKKKEEEQQ